MNLQDVIERLEYGGPAEGQEASVLVVGDAIIDTYEFGRVDRLCPEAPVPVFITERREERPGGAANVHAQLCALGNIPGALWAATHWKQSCKKRFMAGQHMIMRHDHDAGAFEIPGPQDYKHLAYLLEQDPSVIVISDYNKGWVTAQAIKMCIDTKIPVLVDPKGLDFRKYRGCYLLTPNEKEARAFAFWKPEDDNFENILYKRGSKGMQLSMPGAIVDIPASAKHVFDVTGAGDTVIATVAAALAVGAELETACRLAAIAAGYVVGEVGTTVCSLEKLKELVGE